MAQTKKRATPLKGKIKVERRPTGVLRRQSWVVKIFGANGEPLMDSEKYSRHVDALNAANLVASGRFEVEDELAEG